MPAVRTTSTLATTFNHSVSSLIPDEPLLYLERNTFLTLKEERKLLDPNKDNRKVIELLYHEVSPCPYSTSSKKVAQSYHYNKYCRL